MRACLDTRPMRSTRVLEAPTPLMAIVTALVIDGQAEADQALTDAEQTVRRHGLGYTHAYIGYIRAEYLLTFGSLALAEATAREAVETWATLNLDRNLTSGLATLIVALARRGRLEDGRGRRAPGPARPGRRDDLHRLELLAGARGAPARAGPSARGGRRT